MCSEENKGMKKIMLSVVCLLALTFTAIPVGAQTRSRCTSNRTSYDRRYDRQSRYNNQVYRNDAYRNGGYNNSGYGNSGYYGNNGYYDNRSVWQRSRDKITTAGGVAAGTAIGGLIGGQKGAIIGAIAGGVGAALYTYKIRNRYPRY